MILAEVELLTMENFKLCGILCAGSLLLYGTPIFLFFYLRSGWGRGRSLRKFAKAHQLLFSTTYGSATRGFDAFYDGDDGTPLHTMSGSWHGRSICMGDWHFYMRASEGGSKILTRGFSYVLFGYQSANLERLTIRSTALKDQVTLGALGEGIEFESAEFSKKFHVTAENRRFAYDMITPAMMELLLKDGRHIIELDNGGLLIRSHAQHWKAAEFERVANFGVAFLKLVPQHVVESHLPPPPAPVVI